MNTHADEKTTRDDATGVPRTRSAMFRVAVLATIAAALIAAGLSLLPGAGTYDETFIIGFQIATGAMLVAGIVWIVAAFFKRR